MVVLVEMLGRVLVGRIVAAADVSAREAQPEMNPRPVRGKAVLAAVGRCWCDVTHLLEMRTAFHAAIHCKTRVHATARGLVHALQSATRVNALELLTRYQTVRARSVRLCAPLSVEDQLVQSMPDASPAKWHLAHTTWFFERFVLAAVDYQAFHRDFGYLFNSYYDSLGARIDRDRRGMLSRPSLADVQLLNGRNREMPGNPNPRGGSQKLCPRI